MVFQQLAQFLEGPSILQFLGVVGFGTAVGLFLASNVRIGKRSGFQLYDLIGVIVFLVGGAVLALFPASTYLFAYFPQSTLK